jgi:hypothetical protein
MGSAVQGDDSQQSFLDPPESVGGHLVAGWRSTST